MHAIIVLSHPKPDSLTHAVAHRLAQGILDSDPLHSVETADLCAEGFDPRFSRADIDLHLAASPPADDVANEHRRLDRADALILVYPIYWWSFPALLKGWIDRVFTRGWAYDEDAHGRLVKKLSHLAVHQIALGGADQRTYARHGYFGSMKNQIDHGIFSYCGARRINSELLLPSDHNFPAAHLDAAYLHGTKIFAS